MTVDDRGQVVLLAAVVVAVALVSMATAYHGLSYRGDVRSTAAVAADDPVVVAEREVKRTVDAAAVETVRPWTMRNTTTEAVRGRLAASEARLRRGGADRGTVYVVTLDDEDADRWAENDCPGGEMRAFGPCVADGGVVVQERANETVLVGVSVDLAVRTAAGETRASFRVTAR